MEGEIEVTRKDYDQLRKLYDKAIEDDKEVFMYGDQELVVSFAKYILEYMEDVLNINKGGKK